MTDAILKQSSPALTSSSGGVADITKVIRERSPVALPEVSETAWAELAERALEPNIFYTPGWAKAVYAHAPGHRSAKALLAHHESGRLIGVLPVVNARHAVGLPLPMLVAWEAFAPLTSALLDRDCAPEAAARLLDAAEATGAYALLLPSTPTDGPASIALRTALTRRGRVLHVLNAHERAQLVAGGDPDDVLSAALSAKKIKELRRQRNRLADTGVVSYTVASTPEGVMPALEAFLALEDRGWKGRRGTALSRQAGTAAFIREAAASLSCLSQCQIVTLNHDSNPIASAIVLRHHNRAFFFKIAYDEAFAKFSPGVQLTLDLSAQLCRDNRVASADSMAVQDHPMIDRVWVDRLPLGDLFIPLRDAGMILPLLRTTLRLRQRARDTARGAAYAVRRMRPR